jgi:HEAT repeat protein
MIQSWEKHSQKAANDMKLRPLLLVLLVLTCCPPARAAEPLVAGKTLAFWLEELKSDDPLIRAEAVLVLRDAGPAAREAAPRLEKLLKDPVRGVRIGAALALSRIAGQTKPAVEALTEALRDPTCANRAELLGQLGELGGAAAGSAAVVLPFLDDADGPVRTQATLALQRFGSKAGTALVPLLDDTDPHLRRRALSALRLMGPSAEGAVPRLTRLLESGNAELRREALDTLARIGFAARPAAPAILKLAGDPDVRLRAAALTALQSVGAEPRLARQAAREAVEDDDALVRCRGVVLLARVAPNDPEIVPHVLALLEQPVGRSELLGLLIQMGPRAARAVPRLKKLLADADPASRRLAIQALGNMGPRARSAVPALLEQLHSVDGQTRQATVLALRAIGGDSERVVPAIVEAAKQDMTTRSMCLPLLAAHGARAAAAVPWLVDELRRGPPSYISVQMAETLYKIDPEQARKEAVPVLRKMLAPSGPWRVYAARALRHVQPDSDEALEALIDCVKGSNPNYRQQACLYLGELGKSARAAAPALRKALDDPATANRLPTAVALWKVTGETEASVPVLLKALEPSPGHYGYLRNQAAQALGEMGPAVKAKALPVLRKYRDDPDLFVRAGVRLAITRLEGSAQPAPSP